MPDLTSFIRRAGIIRRLMTRKFLRRDALDERPRRVTSDPASCAIANRTLIAFPFLAPVSRRAKLRRKAKGDNSRVRDVSREKTTRASPLRRPSISREIRERYQVRFPSKHARASSRSGPCTDVTYARCVSRTAGTLPALCVRRCTSAVSGRSSGARSLPNRKACSRTSEK